MSDSKIDEIRPDVAPHLVYLLEQAVDWFSDQCSIVNSLNVFPAPDGDTGTNMLLTLRGPLNKLQRFFPNQFLRCFGYCDRNPSWLQEETPV